MEDPNSVNIPTENEFMSSAPLAKAEKNRRSRLRSQARKRLPKLLEEQNHKCKWCGKEIVQTISINGRVGPWIVIYKGENKLAIKSPNTVLFEYNQKIIRMPWATIDHIKPLSEGGKNEKCNLCAACTSCNNERSRISPTKSIVCFCGKKKARRRHEKCNSCKEVEIHSWLTLHGWKKDVLQNAWIDPLEGSILNFCKACRKMGERVKLYDDILRSFNSR